MAAAAAVEAASAIANAVTAATFVGASDAIVVVLIVILMIPSRIPRRRSHPEEDVCVVRGPGCCVYRWPVHSRRRCAGDTQGRRIALPQTEEWRRVGVADC